MPTQRCSTKNIRRLGTLAEIRKLENALNRREWTADEIARAELTEPPSLSSYTSPAGAYILELYARHVHHVDSKFDFHLPRLSPDRD
jgi:hypothetical protein